MDDDVTLEDAIRHLPPPSNFAGVQLSSNEVFGVPGRGALGYLGEGGWSIWERGVGVPGRGYFYFIFARPASESVYNISTVSYVCLEYLCQPLLYSFFI